jgi:hypothetical protein
METEFNIKEHGDLRKSMQIFEKHFKTYVATWKYIGNRGIIQRAK